MNNNERWALLVEQYIILRAKRIIINYSHALLFSDFNGIVVCKISITAHYWLILLKKEMFVASIENNFFSNSSKCIAGGNPLISLKLSQITSMHTSQKPTAYFYFVLAHFLLWCSLKFGRYFPLLSVKSHAARAQSTQLKTSCNNNHVRMLVGCSVPPSCRCCN